MDPQRRTGEAADCERSVEHRGSATTIPAGCQHTGESAVRGTSVEADGPAAGRRCAVEPPRRARRDRRHQGAQRRARLCSPGPHRRRPQGRDLVVGWMRDLGLAVSIDAIGNVVATRPGTDPAAAPVMTGLHIDTVATGGRFDGNLGVLAGLEVSRPWSSTASTTRPDRRRVLHRRGGRRFAPDMLGSLVYVGGMALEEALDVVAVDDGARLGDELAASATPDRSRARRRGASARLRRAAHRAGPDPRGRGRRRSASSKACRASPGPS